MIRCLTISLIVGATLSGCHTSQKTYAAACAVPLSNWGTEKDGVGHLLPLAPFFLGSDGTVIYDKMPTSNNKLRSYMIELSGTNPVPQVVLEVSPAALCERVKEVRSIMNTAPMCKGPHSRCSEGWNAKEWPTSGGP